MSSDPLSSAALFSESSSSESLPSDPHADKTRAALREWILGKATTLDAQTLTDQTPLFSERHLRSIHLPELILLLERLSGRPIDVENLGAGDFRDVETMLGKFAAEPAR